VRPIETWLAAIVFGALASGCAREEIEPEKEPASPPGGTGACALLTQAEVDEIFQTPVGKGASESLEDGSELCSWPAGEDPALLLQVGPLVSDIRAAVDLGEGYRVTDVAGMSGPAAVALGLGEPAGEGSVALLAMNAGDRTVTLSPVGLGVKAETERYETLKAMVERAAERR
jgi:hypothetical protein